MRNSRTRRGILTAEAIVAIALVAFLLVLLAGAVGRQRQASDRLANSRDAVNLAEQTLTAMQSGQDAPKASGDLKVVVTPAEGKASEGMKWVKVEVRINGRSASVIGLVRANAQAGGSK